MKRNRWSTLFLGAAALCVFGQSPPVLACAACFGQSDSAMARGMNMGIFALLFVIVGVLITIASFFVFIARRAAQFPVNEPQPEFAPLSTQV